MKSHYCDTIEFEKNESFNEICVQTLDEDELEQCDKEIDIIVNDSRLSLDNVSDYYMQSPNRIQSRLQIPNMIHSPTRRNNGIGWTLKEELLLKTWMKKALDTDGYIQNRLHIIKRLTIFLHTQSYSYHLFLVWEVSRLSE